MTQNIDNHGATYRGIHACTQTAFFRADKMASTDR